MGLSVENIDTDSIENPEEASELLREVFGTEADEIVVLSDVDEDSSIEVGIVEFEGESARDFVESIYEKIAEGGL